MPIFRKFKRGYFAYQSSVYSTILIVNLLWVAYGYLGKDFLPVIIAIGAVALQFPFKLFWQSFHRPILEIDGVELSTLNIDMGTEWIGTGGEWHYRVNSVIVRNIGKSIAKNCKGYILCGEKWKVKRRICWAISKERPNATINVNDDERLDVCGFYLSGSNIVNLKKNPPKIIIPTEHGWEESNEVSQAQNEWGWRTIKVVSHYPWNYRSLSLEGKGKIGNFRIYVTSENAKPVDVFVVTDEVRKKIKIVDDWSLFRGNR